jgi:hypothetical protein
VKRECARCGRSWPAEQMVYSAATGQRYCAPRHNLERCGTLARRRKRETVAA